MRSLTCQAGDCAHNEAGQCNANVIQVSNTSAETFCNTYTKDETGSNNEKYAAIFSGATDVEFASELFAAPKIMCNVTKCMYNKSFHCKAKGVEIDNPQGTDMCNCITYQQK